MTTSLELLQHVTTGTITTMLLKKGIRRTWMQGPMPLSGSGRRIVGPAFTLRWLLQQGIVIIPRSSKLDRAAENFDVFGFELSAAEMAEIDALKCPNSRLITEAKWAKTWTHPWAPVWDEP